MGHARALLGIKDAEAATRLADEVVRRGLSVREVEGLVQDLGGGRGAENEGRSAGRPAGGGGGRGRPQDPKGRPVWLNEIEETLAEALGTSVSVRYGRKRSRITIECLGREEFERVYELLKATGAS